MKKASKVKEVTATPENKNSNDAKVLLFTLNSDLKKYEQEHVEISFVDSSDLKAFVKIVQEIIDSDSDKKE